MQCHTVRELIFQRIDNELHERENAEFDAHLAACEFCAREYRLLSLPSRMAQGIPQVEPSPYFFQKLTAKLQGEAQNAVGWQIFLKLARQVIPALAGVTLAVLFVFAYFQFTGNQFDIYRAYDRVFITEDQPRPLFYDSGEITDDAVLQAIAEQDYGSRRSRDMK
jgi:predicted anti-sigma-YlaC factor YlaD